MINRACATVTEKIGPSIFSSQKARNFPRAGKSGKVSYFCQMNSCSSCRWSGTDEEAFGEH